MHKKTFIFVGCLFLTLLVQAQDKYFTKSGKISFFSSAPLEDIEAKNGSAIAVLDTKTGALQFSVLMKSFEFEKALMQEHFNENYVESHKYPKAEFRGTILNNSDIDYGKEGNYTVRVKGKLTLHGITKEIQASGSLKVDDDAIKARSSFPLQLSDYKIFIPGAVRNKLSNSIKIDVDIKLEPLRG